MHTMGSNRTSARRTAVRAIVQLVLAVVLVAGCTTHTTTARAPVPAHASVSLPAVKPPTSVASITPAHPFVDVSLGNDRACAVERDGSLWCWMRSFGKHAIVDLDEPRRVDGLTDAVQVVVGFGGAYARRRTGEVVCLGCEASPVALKGVTDAVDVANGERGTCIVSRAGKVACSGRWDWKTLKDVGGIDDAVRVGVGGRQTCVVRRGGSVTCWDGGDDESGPRFATVPGITDATTVVVGDVHACVLRGTGTVACWGEGDLGDGATMDEARERKRTAVVEVKGTHDAVALSADGNCLVERSGTARCWGSNYFGRIGDGTRTDQKLPSAVQNIPAVARIQSTNSRTCAVTTNGELFCWGDFPRFHATRALGISDATFVSAGYDNSCATRRDGTLLCWGARSAVANGEISYHDTNEPEDRYALRDAVSIATATPASHSYDACVVRSAGQVVCYDEHDVLRLAIPDAMRVATGQGHACALRRSGRVVCWGSSDHGQCGPASPEHSNTAHDVGLDDAIAIAAGGDTSCALRKSGAVSCWGGNDWAQLGNGQKARGKNPSPSPVHGLDDAIDVSVGFTHACAVRRSGQVVCWGNNLGGVARVDTLDLKAPTAIGIDDAIKVSAGTEATCVVRKSGKVTCVSVSSSRGMDVLRGGGPYEEDQTKFDIPGLDDVVDVSVGDKHACALRHDGAVFCWGDNERGQIGDGAGPRIPHRLTPN